MIDLNEFRNSKTLKQQQYRSENQILLKEVSDKSYFYVTTTLYYREQNEVLFY